MRAMIFDTHAHYDDEAFDADRNELLAGMEESGIEAVVNIGASLQSSKNTLELIKKWPHVYGAVGVHPSEVEELDEGQMKWLKEAAAVDKVVAIGEIGLDYHWDTPARDLQKVWFVRQLELAREVRLPIVIHSRDAAQDTLELMKAVHAEETGGVIHCFSYGVELAREYLNMGFFLGIGGVLTFKNARKLKEVAAFAPLERLVLETDCPYLAPEPYRGKRNSSYYLGKVVNALAQIKGVTPEEVIAVTNRNAKALYRLPEICRE